jgi:oligopeptide transport system permease protein
VGRYTVRRLLQMIPVVIGTTFIIYAMVWALPGDPFVGKCGDRPCPESYISEMTAKFNLNDPLLVQYGISSTSCRGTSVKASPGALCGARSRRRSP